MITVDNIAREKILTMMESEAEKRPKVGLRIQVSGKTAEKYKHLLSFVEASEVKEDDEVIESNDISIYINKKDKEILKGTNLTYIEDSWESGFKVENPNVPVWDDPHAKEIQELIDEDINPSLAMHGGHVELLDVSNNNVYVKFGGGCHGCGMVDVTVKNGIEQMIKTNFPHIEKIVDTTDHASGTNPYYEPSHA